MKCRGCARSIPANSIYCNWCGLQQIKPANEISVPKPRQLKNGSWFGQPMISGVRVTVSASTESEYYTKARAFKLGLLEASLPENRLVSSVVTEYIDERTNVLSPSTVRNYRLIAENHFQKLMSTKISLLDMQMIQRAVNAEARAYAPKTVRNSWGLISSALRPFVSFDLSSIRLPAKEPKEPVVYDDSLLTQLFTVIKGDPIELAVYLAACLGLRRSEILALKPENFNRQRRTVSVAHARVPNSDNELVEKTTKTTKSFRTISAPEFIFELVPDGDDYIYSGHQQNYILERLLRICKRNGLPPVTLHGLRHSNASIMLKLMPDKYAMNRGGWSSNRTMKDIYQHTFDSEQEKYNALVDAHFTRLANGLLTAPEKR